MSQPTCEFPFPLRRSGEYRKGMIPARPLYQGGSGSVWDPEPSRERVGDWGGPATVWSLLCVAETRATRPNGEWGYSTHRQCWATSAQRWCHPEEALYLPTFSSGSVIYLIVNKLFSLSLSFSVSLSLSLSLFLSLSLARSLARQKRIHIIYIYIYILSQKRETGGVESGYTHIYIHTYIHMLSE